jgi:hypothetical protein
MARTTDQIFTDLLTRKQAEADLDVLNSTSKTSAWRLILWVVAFGIWIHENLWDQVKIDLADLSRKTPAGTPIWYVERALEYQHGDTLQWSGSQYLYLTLNEAAQVVDQAAVAVDGDKVYIKAAKEGSSGLEALSVAEKDGLQAYLDDIKFVGTKLEVVSQAPDELSAILRVFVDTSVISLTGESVASLGVFPVVDEITAYLEGLSFGGVFRIGELIKRLQALPGVVNAVPVAFQGKQTGGSYTPIVDNYVAVAGYMKIDTAATSIQYFVG